MASSKKKSDSSKGYKKPISMKQYVLLAVAGILIAYAIMQFANFGSSGTKAPRRGGGDFGPPSSGNMPAMPGDMDRMPPNERSESARNSRQSDRRTPKNSPEPAQQQKKVDISSLKLLEISPEAQQILSAIQEYRARYDQTVKSGHWSALASWAQSHGLYVEAIHCAAMSDEPDLIIPKVHNTSFFIVDPELEEWQTISQKAYEKSFTSPDSAVVSSYQDIVAQFDEMEVSSSISSQARLAHCLVQVDCERGRELYRESIKDKSFYSVLMREIERSYLTSNVSKLEIIDGKVSASVIEVGPQSDNIWQASWLRPVAMNLWLIEELMKLDPVDFMSQKEKAELAKKNEAKKPRSRKRGRGPGGPGDPHGLAEMEMMGPMGPMGEEKDTELSPALKHRLLILKLLVRRGGLVSADLIGDLFENDPKNTLSTGICSGQIPPVLFSRFTGIYAEPMVEPIARNCASFNGKQSNWQCIATILSRMNNDRMASLVFSTGSKKILSDEMVFFLAVSGSEYTLKNLLGFVQASKVENVDVAKIFSLWTRLSPNAGKTFWSFVSQILPGDSDDSQEDNRKRSALGGMEGMPGVDGMIGAMPDPMMGMGPDAMGGDTRRKSRRSRRGSRRDEDTVKTHGWPLERRFLSSVNKDAACDFLQALGQLAATGNIESAAMDGQSGKRNKRNRTRGEMFGPGMVGPGMMGRGGDQAISSLSNAAKIRVKRSAMQCLVTLNDLRLTEYFQSSINQPLVGDYARLGLCVLDSHASGPVLLTHFWKHPLELNPAVDGSSTSGRKSKSSNEDFGVTSAAGHIGVPLDEMGLPRCGVTARDALIYLDYVQAQDAFLAALGAFVTQKNAYDNPEEVSLAAQKLIETLGRWNPPNTAATLADLIESTSDFGLRGDVREIRGEQVKNPYATSVRMKALAVLGEIGDEASMNVIFRIASYSQPGELMGLAAKVALARRGSDGAADLFLDMLDPGKANEVKPKGRGRSRGADDVSKIDPTLKIPEDIAFLGLSRVRLNDRQVSRALELIAALGDKEVVRSNSDFQSRLVLSLLEGGQPEILGGIAQMIGDVPDDHGGKSARRDDPYYWNRVDGEAQDDCFVQMVEAIRNHNGEENKDDVVAFITAILQRQESQIIPDHDAIEAWDASKAIVVFSGKSSSRGGPGGVFDPMMMSSDFAAVPPSVKSKSKRKKQRGRDRFQLSIKFPEVARDVSSHNASILGLEVIGDMPNAEAYLQKMQEMDYFRYFANVVLWKHGFEQGGDAFVNILTDDISKKDMYLYAIAMSQLREQEGINLTALLTRVLAANSNVLINAITSDVAMYVAIEAWREQMAGGSPDLSDPEQVDLVAEAWKPIARGRKLDWPIMNRLVVALSVIQSNPEAVKWLDSMVAAQCSRDTPLSEDAVSSAVTILRTLNVGGSEELLDFYVTLLELTFDPVKAKSEMQKVQDKSRADMEMGMGFDADMERSKNGRAKYSRKSVRNKQRVRSVPQIAYPSLGSTLVQAIGSMRIPQAQKALIKLSRSREDLLDVIGAYVYVKDAGQGRSLFKQLFDNTARDENLSSQGQQAMRFLLLRPDMENMELIVHGIVKADSDVAEAGVKGLIALYTENKIPAGFDINNSSAKILTSLVPKLRAKKDVKGVVNEMLLFAESLDDPDVNKLVEQVEKLLESTSNTRKTTKNKPVRRRTSKRRY